MMEIADFFLFWEVNKQEHSEFTLKSLLCMKLIIYEDIKVTIRVNYETLVTHT